MTCPQREGPVRLLFDSEKGAPRSKFDAGSTWRRAPNSSVFPHVEANATSGRSSWFSSEPIDVTVSSLRMDPVALPAGRPAYLWFEHWRILESVRSFDGTQDTFDAGTVEVADTSRGRGPKRAEGLPWVNGPKDVLDDRFDNPSPGRVGFSRDSRGYLASRMGLKRYAGHAVSPQFTMNTDNNSTEYGWYLDDVRIYTCGHAPVPRSTPRISGSATVGTELKAHSGRWSPSAAKKRVQWYADGHPIAGATGRSYDVRGSDVGKRITIKVSATSHGRHASTFSPAKGPVTT
jgi:hypothetical protein